MNTEQTTVGQFLFDYIYNQGVKHVFGIPGDFALPTFRWLDKSPLDIITMTHEPSVGFAADAYARINGLGVACVTYCVGGLNMLNSVACAYAEKSPIIVISGGPSPSERRNDSLIHHKVKTFDSQRRIYEEVTCANAVLDDPETAALEIMRVVEAVQRHCRPGYIEMPYDVVDMPITLHPVKNSPPAESDPEMLEACIEAAADFINGAKQPVIVAGVELHRHGIADKALDIAKAFNIPICATLDSKSVIRETNPLYIGVYNTSLSDPKCQEYVDNSDCIILLGTFISDVFMGFTKNELERRNSILVTSEKARVRMHSFDDVRLEDFVEGLANANINKRETFVNPNPAIPLAPLEDKDRDESLSVNLMFRVLEPHIEEGGTVICDVGDSLLGAVGIRTSKRRNFVADAYYLSMGFAMPAAIGVLANQPNERAFAIIGDGAFQMTGTEVSTAAKYGLAPIVLVMNNDGYGTQRNIIDGTFNDIQPWSYHKVAALVGGCTGKRVETAGELDDALKEALSKHEPYIIEVMIPRGDCSEPLRRLGESLAAQRDVSKRKQAA